ncbi:MAG: type II secretion system secretin GspD [Hyphomicrobium sp.]
MASGLVRVLVTAAGALMGACTLPNEQLSLPTPISPPLEDPRLTTGGIGGKGVPLGSQGDPAAAANRIYPGSTDFLNESRFRAPRATATVAGNGVTLDLVNASPAEAAKAVLGDALGLNYVVSDKLKAPITLKTAQPVSPDDLLQIFEAALAVSGAGLVNDGAAYRVVPVDEAITAGKSVRTLGAPGRRLAGLSTEVVPLRFVAAAEMERILRSVAPQSAIARVDSSRNLLMLSGTSNELTSMIETIRIFDVDYMRGMSFGIFPVETSDVVAITRELDTIFANDSESPTKGLVRFVPNARLKSVLVITSRPSYLQKAETWIRRIDMMGQATEKQAFVYHVQFRPATEVAQLLQKVYAARRVDSASGQQSTASTTTATAVSTGGELLAPSPASSSLASPAIPSPQPISPATPVITTGVHPGGMPVLNAPTATAAQASGGSTVGIPGEAFGPSIAEQANVGTVAATAAPPQIDDRTSGIAVVADETNNAVIVTATPAEMRRVKHVLYQIDVQPNQVLLEATIAEVTLNDDLKQGVRWFFEHGGSEFRLTDSATGLIEPVFPGFSYFLNLTNIRVALNALASITNVNVVSSPSMTVLDNKKAVLQIGDEVPVPTQSAVSVVTPDAPIVNAITFRNTGVILAITPRVADNGRVLLDIEQEVSDAIPTVTSGIDAPTIQQRRIKTTVTVSTGETVVLAGFMRDRATRDRGQVPILGDIPILGNAFKNKQDTIERTELLIAITPQILHDDSQLRQVAAEFRDRLNFNTRPQRETPPEFRENLDRLAR